MPDAGALLSRPARRGRNPEELEETLTLGPDPDEYVEQLREYEQAGYTHAYIHQIGPDQQGFLDFARTELLPRI